MNIEFFKTWLLPPLVGAIIGYFTNWLAIKMLFRPYREIRIAGIRLPFTPGILPRERSRLAQSLGETLAHELLTPEVISRRFRSPQVQNTASIAAEAALRGFLEMDAELLFRDEESSPSASSAQEPHPLREKEPGASVPSQKGQILDSLRSLAASPAFQDAVRNLIDELSARIGDLKLNEILSRDQFVSIMRQAVSTLPAGSSGLCNAFALLIHIPPDSAVRVLSEKVVPPAYRLVLPAMKTFLRSEDFHRRLEAEGLALVRRALERLGPMQRLFVSLAGYEARIAQTMPETIEDLIDTIEILLDDPSVPERLAQALCGVLIEQRTALFARMNSHGGAADSTSSPALAEEIAQAFKDSDEEFAARSAGIYDRIAQRRLASLVGAGFEPGILSSAVMSAANRLLQPAPQEEASPGTGSLVRLIKEVLRDAARGKSVARFLGIDDESISRIAAALSSRLLDIVAGRMPFIVEALDIQTMVAERIDSLDMAEVERLVLQVARKELAWITWLGGFLGAMIGLLQGLVSLL